MGMLISILPAQDLWNQFEQGEGEKVSSDASIAPGNSVSQVSSVALLSSSSSQTKISSSSLSSESASSSATSSSSVASSSSQTAGSSQGISSSQEKPLSSSSESKPVSSSVFSSSSLVLPPSSSFSSSSLSPVEPPPGLESKPNYVVPLPTQVTVSSSSSSQQRVSSSSLDRRSLLGPVKVSRVRGINEMKGRYKSPKKALFLSLVVPGAGQIYVGNSKFNIARGVGYILIESALLAGWYHYSVTLYDRQVRKYEKYAKEHFSPGMLEANYRSLYGQLADVDEEKKFTSTYLLSRDEYCQAMYGSASQNECYNPEDGTSPYLLDPVNTHASQFTYDKNLGEELEAFGDLWNQKAYYQLLANDEFVLGWMDVKDMATAAQLDLKGDTYYALGSSDFQATYQSQRNRANELADMQAWFLGGLLLNHLVSAIDATLAAHAHNKALYEEKISWYDQIRLESAVSYGGFSGSDLSAAVRARWDF